MEKEKKKKGATCVRTYVEKDPASQSTRRFTLVGRIIYTRLEHNECPEYYEHAWECISVYDHIAQTHKHQSQIVFLAQSYWTKQFVGFSQGNLNWIYGTTYSEKERERRPNIFRKKSPFKSVTRAQ